MLVNHPVTNKIELSFITAKNWLRSTEKSFMLFNHPVTNKIELSFMQLKIGKGVFSGRSFMLFIHPVTNKIQ
jgi:hypothetical protein